MANRGHLQLVNNFDHVLGRLPTTDTICREDVAMLVVQQSRRHSNLILDNHWTHPSPQIGVSRPYVVLQYVIALYSKTRKEIWSCDMSSTSSPNEVLVNNGEYRIILKVYPQRNTVISKFTLDLEGRQLPPHACTFSLHLPACNFPTIYNVTIHLVKTGQNNSVLCDEKYYGIITSVLGSDQSTFQEGMLNNIEHPLPRIKLKGMLGSIDGWRILMHFENLADNGEFAQYRQHRQQLESRTSNRQSYKDLVAMVLLEEGVACLIQNRLREGVALAKRACRLSSHHSCVNDRAILGYAYAVYAAAARFAGDLDGAKKNLTNALEIFEPMEPSSYTSITLYNIGAIIMEKSARVGVSEAEEKEAESALRLAEQHWMHQSLNTTFRVLPRIYNRLISIYLKSSPNTAPDLTATVSQQSLARAKEKIRRVEEHLLPHCTNWLLTTIYLAKTDLYIRTGDTNGGLRVAQQSLQVATQSGLQRETQGARERINLLQLLSNNRPPPGDPADML